MAQQKNMSKTFDYIAQTFDVKVSWNVSVSYTHLEHLTLRLWTPSVKFEYS